ncbi:MAG: type II toxin-antitoxin system VapB family antitoxin [Opitutales bacterium]
MTVTVDDTLVQRARDAGKLGSPEAAVEEALREFVAKRQRLEIIELFGTMDPDPGYDYKQARQR